MKSYISLGLHQIVAAYIFVLLVLFLLRNRNQSTGKQLIIACIRMTIQLILLGYILTYIFTVNHWLLSMIVVITMEIFAIINIFKMLKFNTTKKMKRTIGFSFGIGTMIGFVFFIFIVIQLKPWYASSYFIPLAGMIIGNSMTGVTLGINHLNNNMKTQKEFIENALALGAEPKEACKNIVDDSFDSAILPTINAMLGIGIVFIPGMMTGQIVAGAMPINAIKYQLVIMLAILGSVAISSILAIILSYKTFFNDQKQLINE